eukprot:1956321-Rhodomonas_salina.1
MTIGKAGENSLSNCAGSRMHCVIESAGTGVESIVKFIFYEAFLSPSSCFVGREVSCCRTALVWMKSGFIDKSNPQVVVLLTSCGRWSRVQRCHGPKPTNPR